MKQLAFWGGIASFILLSMNTYAQEQDLDVEIKEKMDVVLEHLDKSKVETGLLADYGAWLLDPYDYDGTISEDNYGSIGFWKMLYLGAYTSQINGNSHLVEPETVFNGLQNDSPVMLHLQYNSIDEEVVEKGILTYENGQLRETGSPVSPYVKRKMFVLALPDKEYNQSVSFTFREGNYIHNQQGMPVQMLIRFENNLPYQQFTWGQTIQYTYSSNGTKEITIRLRMADGSYVEGHAQIQIVVAGPKFDIGKDPVDERIRIQANGEHSGGEIQIKYATSLNDSTKEKQLIRPLIIADESGLLEFFSDTTKMDLRYLLTNSSTSKIVAEINKVYDIVYIDNNDSFDDIFRNAKLFEEAVQRINAKRGAIHDKNYVIGLGMGGLVARYALRDMETQRKTHDVVKFITVNSPHKGANIPVGIQATLQYLKNRKILKFFASDLYDKVSDIRKLFDKKAMRQMLIYTMDKNYNYLNDHNAFMQEYERMGMPEQCKNIAITNGGLGSSRVGTEGSLLFRRHDKAFGADISAYFLKHKTEFQFFSGIVKAFWCNFKKVNLKSNSTMVAADGAPGSFIPLNILSNDLAQYLKVSNFCFVPTASALGLNEWENQLLSLSSLNPSMSCFDQLYVADKSNGYQELAACKDALIEELAPLIKGSRGSIISETEYQLINLPAMITSNPIFARAIGWRITNDNFKIVSRNGDKVTIVPLAANSTAKLIASLSLNGITSDVDSVALVSMDFNILPESGDYVLRGAGSRFRVNIFSPNSTITWSYMDRIQVKEQKDDYIVIAGCGIYGAWLQANVTVNGRSFSKRISLKPETLPSDLTISVNPAAWQKDNGEVWYLLHAEHDPCVSGETFEWKLKSTYSGETCAEFYSFSMVYPHLATSENGGFSPIDPGTFMPEGGWDAILWYERLNVYALPADYRILIFTPETSYTDVSCSLKSPCKTLDADIIMSYSGEVPAWEVPELELKFGSLYTKDSQKWQSVYLEHTPCNASMEEITWEISGDNERIPALTKKRPADFHLGGNTPILYKDSIEAGHNEIFIKYNSWVLLYSALITSHIKVGNNIFTNEIEWKTTVPIIITPNPGNGAIWIGGGIGGRPISRNGISPMSISSTNTSSDLYSIRIYGNYGLVRSFDNVSLDVPFEVNTADLPNGNYYLNVFRNGTLIDQQIILIQH